MGVDKKSIVAIVISALCTIAIIIGYTQAARIGILYTFDSIPFYGLAIVLSALSFKNQNSKQPVSKFGLTISIGGLALSWLIAGIVFMVGLLSGLDSSTASDIGLLSTLNYD